MNKYFSGVSSEDLLKKALEKLEQLKLKLSEAEEEKKKEKEEYTQVFIARQT